MSPARVSDYGGGDECDGGGPSGYSPETTLRTVPVGLRGGRGRGLGSRDVAGFAFCLHPLVRARPKQGKVKSKSLPKEVGIVAVTPQLEAAVPFCKNRSRKIADFGIYHRRH